ncbi:mechanosensitive ion channel [Hymenobacter taeanensis]|uniref:Mechanosensitive ion channel n=1 Tax=Hymenobacter taeanensis TaxID=2735321 RepID=A0A6M6BJW0_9BACT|nr:MULTISPECIES: mechanosensitive ion channel domain-containing protein [Hymenobacter]QJX48861.1 mechanosensitive ion channel [Hymenobacter taeanensis]UOQ81627.1 mechanosensitive ion channel [Hymenobacter sp. 5414T-23]
MLQDLNRVLAAYWQQFLFILPKLLIAGVLLLIAIFIANRASNLLGRRLRSRSSDPLLPDFLANISRWVMLLAGLLLAFNILGFSGVVGSLIGAAGVSAFVVGFALKDIAENFLAGVILAFNRPFHINDTVQVRDLIGHVEALNLRTTLMRTFDGKHIFLPNSMVLKEPLTNFTRDGNLRQEFTVTVELGQDVAPDAAINVILNYLRTVPDVQQVPRSPYVNLEKATATTADLRVYFWTDSEDFRRGVIQQKSRLMQEVKLELIGAGLSVPALGQ